MADNVAITPGTGATIAADDVGGVLFQRIKLAWGVDGVATDASASAPLPIELTNGRKATYAAVIPGFLPTQTGVVIQMQGVAGKVIRIKRVTLAGHQGTAGLGNIEARRYSSSVAGTLSAQTSYPLDSINAAASAVLNTIVAPGSSGTLVGRFRAAPMLFGSATVPEKGVDLDFDGPNDQGLVLRGAGEFFGVYLNAAAFTGLAVYGSVEWTEE